MPAPTLPWAGYNLFRLAAVVFMAWALVVQFVALADDMNAYNAAKEAQADGTGRTATTAPSAMSAPAGATSSGNIVGTFGNLATPASDGASSPRPTPALGTVSPPSSDAEATAPVQKPSLVSASTRSAEAGLGTTRPVGVIGIDPESVPALLKLRRAAIRGRAVSRRDEEDSTEGGYYVDSAIPDQPGGLFFVVVSRVMIALLALFFAQLGLPEETLYKYGGLFGPHGTPLALGGAQSVIAVETLRVWASQTVRVPSWCLLGVGLTNALLGCALLFLGRRLPKDPPPPLYFSRMMRLLFWTRPPDFYRKLDPNHPSYPENAREVDAAQHNSPDVEKQVAQSNALEIGLEASDDEEGSVVEIAIRHGRERVNEPGKTTRTRVAKEHTPHTDVTQGGYPTFSGHAVNAAGRNVPAGYIDDERGDIRFVSEEAQRIRDMQDRQASLVSSLQGLRRPQMKTAVIGQRKRDSEFERKSGRSKSAKPAPIDTSSISALRRPPARSNSRNSATSAALGWQQSGGLTLSRSSSKVHHGTRDVLTPIGERDEPASAKGTRSELRRSLQAAAGDLGPRFPLPPSRLHANGVDQVPQSPEAQRARRGSYVDSLAGGAAWGSMATGAAQSTEDSQSASPMPVSDGIPISTLRLGAHDGALPSEPGLLSPGSTNLPEARRSATRPRTMLRSSLAPEKRSPMTAEARTERVSRGVRFDPTSPEAYSPYVLTGSSGSPDVVSSAAKSGFRIPGTSLTIPLPFSAPSAPRTARNDSLDSTATSESDVSATRAGSVASAASTGRDLKYEWPEMAARELSDEIDPACLERGSDEAVGIPRRGATTNKAGRRPKSAAVLGGANLDGGTEVSYQSNPRRRYSSFDSS